MYNDFKVLCIGRLSYIVILFYDKFIFFNKYFIILLSHTIIFIKKINFPYLIFINYYSLKIIKKLYDNKF